MHNTLRLGNDVLHFQHFDRGSSGSAPSQAVRLRWYLVPNFLQHGQAYHIDSSEPGHILILLIIRSLFVTHLSIPPKVDESV